MNEYFDQDGNIIEYQYYDGSPHSYESIKEWVRSIRKTVGRIKWEHYSGDIYMPRYLQGDQVRVNKGEYVIRIGDKFFSLASYKFLAYYNKLEDGRKEG